MYNISLASTLHKHKIAGTAPWYALMEFHINSAAVHLYLALNPEDITHKGQVYTAFAFDLGALEEKSSGELPQLQLRVCNVDRIMEGYLNQYTGGVGAEIYILAVSGEDLNALPAQKLYFTVTGSSSDAQWVYLTLGAGNPQTQKFPKFTYIKDHCIWLFNSPAVRAAADPRGCYCGYLGSDISCNHTLADCTAKANAKNFGGFPGIDSIGFRAAGPV